MSRTDAMRWQDWRTSRGRSLRPVRHCQCGNDFAPVVQSQALCEACAAEQASTERARLRGPTTPAPDALLAEAERQETLARVQRQLGVPIREPIAGPRGQEPTILSKRPKRRKTRIGRGKKANHSRPADWAHIALRRWKAGAEPRKIAAFLGVPVPEVLEVIRGHELPPPIRSQPENRARPDTKAKRKAERRRKGKHGATRKHGK